ncbi:DUF2163 domain-containing protein [Amylibacter sp. IMCC11727]|uniref:DUF2163 domain-containing protein n=1 Tax=Amylibacter sp. IMCC11727 TaxID=3039851 RepID=UPI00244E18E0|nr:DUF2163 domain-containing protein [Amylibacter sp. IMCC11727]WGI20830.1 DUF2163 domain-containing protein [Amylibacter sp. IMCC11727]
MRHINENLQAHLDTGATNMCRAWIVTRQDGVTFGFTDHDKALVVDGVSCEAASSMDATAVETTTGLSVDNSQAVGALSSAGITDLDIETGKFDGAEVRHFLVNWRDTDQKILQFRGSLGEIRRGSGAFEAELRGLSEALNKPVGRAYLRQCDRILGDAKCGVDIFAEGFVGEDTVYTSSGRRVVELQHLGAFEQDWFVGGKATWVTGANAGSDGLIKVDHLRGLVRVIELFEETKFPIENGDILRVHAGCDKHAETCKGKFGNFANFRGFPHIPGEDWSVAYPVAGTNMNGARRP